MLVQHSQLSYLIMWLFSFEQLQANTPQALTNLTALIQILHNETITEGNTIPYKILKVNI